MAWLRGAPKMCIPETTMKLRNFSTCSLTLLLAMPAWGQTQPVPASEVQRPLNLSLPRDVLRQPATVIHNDADESAARNLRKEEEAETPRPPRYGAGYEARQRGLTAESVGGYGSGMGAPMRSGTGFGGGGRGGMGRGR